jgi:hypothetical protein
LRERGWQVSNIANCSRDAHEFQCVDYFKSGMYASSAYTADRGYVLEFIFMAGNPDETCQLAESLNRLKFLK